MTEREMRHMSRVDLLNIILKQSEEINALRTENEELHGQIEDKTIAINESGSMAEACLRVNRVFEAAEAAVAQYKENIERLSENQDLILRRKMEECRRQAEKMLREAQSRAEATVAAAESEAEEIVKEAQARADAMLRNAGAGSVDALREGGRKTEEAASASENRSRSGKHLPASGTETGRARFPLHGVESIKKPFRENRE